MGRARTERAAVNVDRIIFIENPHLFRLARVVPDQHFEVRIGVVELSDRHRGAVPAAPQPVRGIRKNAGTVVDPPQVGLAVVDHEGVQVSVVVEVRQGHVSGSVVPVGDGQRLCRVEGERTVPIAEPHFILGSVVSDEGVQIPVAVDVSQRHGGAWPVNDVLPASNKHSPAATPLRLAGASGVVDGVDFTRRQRAVVNGDLVGPPVQRPVDAKRIGGPPDIEIVVRGRRRRVEGHCADLLDVAVQVEGDLVADVGHRHVVPSVWRQIGARNGAPPLREDEPPALRAEPVRLAEVVEVAVAGKEGPIGGLGGQRLGPDPQFDGPIFVPRGQQSGGSPHVVANRPGCLKFERLPHVPRGKSGLAERDPLVRPRNVFRIPVAGPPAHQPVRELYRGRRLVVQVVQRHVARIQTAVGRISARGRAGHHRETDIAIRDRVIDARDRHRLRQVPVGVGKIGKPRQHRPFGDVAR